MEGVIKKFIIKNMDNISTNLILVLVIILMTVGFFFTLNRVQSVENAINDLELNMDLLNETFNENIAIVTPSSKSTSTKSESSEITVNGNNIPTAIIFEAKSSPLLSPQTNLKVIVEEVSKNKEGTVMVGIKVFSDKAESYSAFNPSNFFELVDLEVGNQKPLKVQGSFDSIPPKSVVKGKIIFKTSAENDEIILQVNLKNEINYYKFNFNKGTYEETILG